MTFYETYKKKVLPELQKTLGKKNIMSVPRLKSIRVHVGIGSIMTRGNKDYEGVISNIAAITGQKPVVTKAKKAISNFKTRIGLPVGILVTLRGKRMYDFMAKIIHVVLPRVRDFRGLSRKCFDSVGNYSMGMKEHIVFPEINADDIEKVHGLQVTFEVKAKNAKEGYELLSAMGLPFRKDELISEKKSKK